MALGSSMILNVLYALSNLLLTFYIFFSVDACLFKVVNSVTKIGTGKQGRRLDVLTLCPSMIKGELGG